MTGLKTLISAKKSQYRIFTVLALAVVGLTGVLNYSNGLIFQRFTGRINPLLAMIVIAILGLALLSFLLSKGWFSIYRRKNLKVLFGLSLFVFVFASIAILVDWAVTFPKDINISFPLSLLFYPAIGFLVEIIFHILPLSLLLFFLTSIFKNVSFDKILFVCIVIVATLEPTYQIIFTESFPNWAILLIWLNLFLFNGTQLLIFKKYDFISMYLFRLIYYAIWHIIWGHIRLSLLF